MGLCNDECIHLCSIEIKGNYTGVLIKRNYASTCDSGFVVMWSGRANELWLNVVNPSICSYAEVYIVMDHETGETCFYWSLNVMRYFHNMWGKFTLQLIYGVNTELLSY